MDLERRRLDTQAELRSLLDFSHQVWVLNSRLLNSEMSYGTLAWAGGGVGRARAFHDRGGLRGWCRLVPGYSRIRAAGRWDQAPPSLVWQTDPSDDARRQVLEAMLNWAGDRAESSFTTFHNPEDELAEAVLSERGFVPDATEPFGGYMHQPLDREPPKPDCPGYRFLTMADLDDIDRRADVHRLAWDGSTRTGDDVRRTMATWPYKPSLDFIAVSDDGDLAASALCWYDPVYRYGEFEPVGTVPEHRGTGVATALLHFGLRRLREAGADHAVVGARADRDYPAPRHLYRSAGFQEVTTQIVVRSPDPS